MGNKVCKADLMLFTFQVIVILIVICTSLFNLSVEHGNQNLWTVVLTSSLGYILPNPRVKYDKNTDVDEAIKDIEDNIKQ